MNEAVNKLVAALPKGGGNSPGDASSRKLIADLFAMGPNVAADVVELLKPAEEGGDAQARLALHNLATYAAGQEEPKRKAFAEALALQFIPTIGLRLSQPRDNRSVFEVAEFIIRQLQLCGGPEVVPYLAGWLSDETLGEPACLALVAIRQGAAPHLVTALGKAAGRLKLVLVQNLGILRDSKAIPALRACLEDNSTDLRLAAAWALANIGSGDDAPRLLALVRREEGYARAKAIDAAFLMAQRLGESDKTKQRVELLKELLSAPGPK